MSPLRKLLDKNRWAPAFDCIPEELRAGVRHVNWRYEGSPETKVLKIAGTLRNASSTNPETWRTFGKCRAMFEKRPIPS